MYIFLGIAFIVVMLIAWGQIFKKAGYHPAKVLIPVYGNYLQYNIADSSGLFFLTLGLSVLYSIVSNVSAANMSRSRYSYYSSYQTPSSGVLIFLGIIAIAMAIISIIFLVRLARVFGKSDAFAVGLILLYPIFICILAFGDAEYQGMAGSGYTGKVVTDEWTCERCGTRNPSSSGLCSNCGASKPYDK